MKTREGGHSFLGSDLFFVSIENKNGIQLTFSENDHEFYPEWSPTTNQIAYFELKSGIIFIADIVIN